MGLWIAALLISGGCTQMDISLSTGIPKAPSGHFRAGFGMRDITPPPGFPMAGYSLDGQIGRGRWTSLRVVAAAFEDANGETLLLINADLWSIPLALSDRVCELVATEFPHVGRQHVVMAATHTHHAPGNMTGDGFWNQFASPRSGFDPDLFEWLAAQSAAAATEALGGLTAVELHFGTADVSGMAFNRSLKPFQSNPEACAYQKDVRRRLSAATTDEQASVNPRVSTIVVTLPGDRAAVLGVLAFAAFHPTATGLLTGVYSSDAFGLAAQGMEADLKRDGGAHARVMIFNGAEGDVAAGEGFVLAQQRDRRLAVSVSDRLQEGISAAIANAKPLEGTAIQRRVNRSTLGDTRWQNEDGQVVGTAARALIGAPVVGGADDGITKHRGPGFEPGVRGGCLPDQAPKLPVPSSLLGLSPELGAFLMGLVVPPSRYPNDSQVGVHQIGPLALVTLPGEFSTLQGERIRRRVMTELGSHGEHTLLLGLADGFLYYVTTEEEYKAQHYEGAATLYGGQSGNAFERRFAHLASLSGSHSQIPDSAHYAPGPRRTFGAHDAYVESHRIEDGLRHLKVDRMTGQPLVLPPQWEFWSKPMSWPAVTGESIGWPEIHVEVKTPEGNWVSTQDPWSPGSLLLVLKEARSHRWFFQATALDPPSIPGTTWRFRVLSSEGVDVFSEAFSLSSAQE